jgi:peptidoglycan/LPS O-acetylase OafA/YrhL
MKPWNWLRIGASLQALGAVLHTIASTDPPSRGPAEEAVFAAMQSFHFQIAGVNRSHWDFYRGYELSITVVFGILAVLIWQLSNLSRREPREAVPLIVTILVAEILLSAVGWEYFFAGPGGVSILIAACLAAAVVTLRRSDQPTLASSRAAKAG